MAPLKKSFLASSIFILALLLFCVGLKYAELQILLVAISIFVLALFCIALGYAERKIDRILEVLEKIFSMLEKIRKALNKGVEGPPTSMI